MLAASFFSFLYTHVMRMFTKVCIFAHMHWYLLIYHDDRERVFIDTRVKLPLNLSLLTKSTPCSQFIAIDDFDATAFFKFPFVELTAPPNDSNKNIPGQKTHWRVLEMGSSDRNSTKITSKTVAFSSPDSNSPFRSAVSKKN